MMTEMIGGCAMAPTTDAARDRAVRAMGLPTANHGGGAGSGGEWLAFAREHAAEVDYRPIPLRDYVLVEQEKQKQSAGGLVIPENSTEHTYAVVVAVGPGKYDDGVFIPTQLRPGDRLLFDAQMLGEVQVIRWRGKNYGMVRESCVGGVLPGPLPEAPLVIAAAAPSGLVLSERG